MKLSTRSRYGLRAMIELARLYSHPAMMTRLADSQKISVKYLHHLLTRLKKSGLIVSLRGSRGGFKLSRHPSEIRVSDIFTSLEGPISIVDCLTRPDRCELTDECIARRIWQDVNIAIETALSRTTLQDLIAGSEYPGSAVMHSVISSLPSACKGATSPGGIP